MDDDCNELDVRPIPESVLYRLLYISRRDPTIYACFGEYATMLKLNDILLKGSSPNPMAIDNIIHREYIIPFATEAFMLFQIWGFCPYIITEVDVDAKHDTWWMEHFSSLNTKNIAKLPVLHVPVFGSYTVELVKNKRTNRQTIRCIDKRALNSNTLDAGREFPTIKVMQTLISTNRPDFYDLSINTAIATVANSFYSINQLESFTVGAHYANAYPKVAMEMKPITKDDVLETVTTELFGDTENNPQGKQETYLAINGIALALEDEQNKLEGERHARSKNRTAFYSNPANLDLGHIPLTRPIEVDTFNIPPKMMISPNQGPTPIAPPDMTDRHNRHNQYSCNALKLPYSILSRDGVMKQYSTSDLQLLTKTIRFLETDINHIFDIILVELKMIGHYKLEIHPQVFVEFEQLMKMAELELISRPQVREIMEDSQSLKKGKLPKKEKKKTTT